MVAAVSECVEGKSALCCFDGVAGLDRLDLPFGEGIAVECKSEDLCALVCSSIGEFKSCSALKVDNCEVTGSIRDYLPFLVVAVVEVPDDGATFIFGVGT